MAVGPTLLIQLPHGPQRSGGGVCFFAPGYFVLDVGIFGLAHIALKAGTVFAQVMPQSSQRRPRGRNFLVIQRTRKLPGPLRHGLQMPLQQMTARMRPIFGHGNVLLEDDAGISLAYASTHVTTVTITG